MKKSIFLEKNTDDISDEAQSDSSVGGDRDYRSYEDYVKQKSYERNFLLSESIQEKLSKDLKVYIDNEIKNTLVEIGNAKKDIEVLKKELKNDIDSNKLSSIESLGIFVALFTFISIEFQVFRSYRNPHAISGLTLIFLGAIFLFLIFFDYLLNKSNENNSKVKNRKSKFFYVMPSISVLLLVGGIFLYCSAPNEDLEEAKDSIKRQVYDSVKNDIDLKNDELLETNKNNEFLINDLRDDVETIKNCVNNFGFSYKCFK